MSAQPKASAAQEGIARFVASNAREALRQVRAGLGTDAIVLSTRQTPAGVVVIAAAQSALDRMTGVLPAAPAAATTAPAPVPSAMIEELRALSAQVREQLGRLAWDDAARQRPLRGMLARELAEAGFGERLARELTGRLPDDFAEPQARRWLTSALATNLKCAAPAEDPVERGGVLALVGPTGVGKTTTVAKLAARCVVRHGAASLGLVTTDGYRVGAYEQLKVYGRILGVSVQAANDAEELGRALDGLSGKRLVLVDTVGIGQRDARMGEHLSLVSRAGMQRVLVLAACAQAEALEDALLAYRGAGLSGLILSKLDEAVKIGGALDAAIRHRTRLLAVSNGQRVPEDLHAANPLYLVDRALRRPAHA